MPYSTHLVSDFHTVSSEIRKVISIFFNYCKWLGVFKGAGVCPLRRKGRRQYGHFIFEVKTKLESSKVKILRVRVFLLYIFIVFSEFNFIDLICP